jgi:hypothetical protein
MTDTGVVHRLFNRYSLVARVYPSLLALAPILWSALVLFPRLVANYRDGFASTFAIGCSLYLLASLARARGKSAEIALLESWGGWPTTLLLRHRDASIDPITKARYHLALAAMLGRALPTVNEEAANATGADDVYRSATKRLIEARRAKTYQLLQDENASYGFRRNLFGLRWVAVYATILAAVTTGLIGWASLEKPIDLLSLEVSVETYPHLPILLAADLGYMALMTFMINPEFIRQAADEYALALFRTLDQP